MSKLKLTRVRLSFPTLWTPEEYQAGDGKPRYGASFLVPKDDPQIATIKQALLEAGADKFGQKFHDKNFRKGVKIHCFRDGDEQSYDGYEGHMVVSANKAAKQGKPTVVDWDKSELREADGRPYAGCYVNAVVEFYGDSRYGKALNGSLVAVQFAGHGPAFAGGSKYSEDDFDTLDPEEVGEGLDTEETEPATAGSDYEDDDDDPLS